MKSIFIRYSLALLVALSSSIFSFFLLPLTMYTTYFLLRLFSSVQMIEGALQFGEVRFLFIPACAATLAYILLLECILLTRGISFQKALKMFFCGALAVFFMNVLRILLLIWVYVEYGKNYFDVLHILFWQFVSVFFVVAVWIALVEYFHIKAIPMWSDVKDIFRN